MTDVYATDELDAACASFAERRLHDPARPLRRRRARRAASASSKTCSAGSSPASCPRRAARSSSTTPTRSSTASRSRTTCARSRRCRRGRAPAVMHPVDRRRGAAPDRPRRVAARRRPLRRRVPGRAAGRGLGLLAHRLALRRAVGPEPRLVAVGRVHDPPRRDLAAERLPARRARFAPRRHRRHAARLREGAGRGRRRTATAATCCCTTPTCGTARPAPPTTARAASAATSAAAGTAARRPPKSTASHDFVKNARR